MHVELTEQQARAVAQAARMGLVHDRDHQRPVMGPGDTAAAHVAADILDEAVRKAVGR